MQKKKIFLILISLILVISIIIVNNQNINTKQASENNNQLIIKNLEQYNIDARCSEDSDCTIFYGYEGIKCTHCNSCITLKPEDNLTIAVRKDWKDDCPPRDPLILCLQCISPLTITDYTAEAKCIKNICQKVLTKINPEDSNN